MPYWTASIVLGVLDILVSVIGPVVAIVAVGALVGPRLGLETATLSRLAFWILGPAFIFDGLAEADLPRETVLGLAAASVAGMVVAGLVGAGISKLMGNDFENISVDVVSSTYGNVGNTGIAICVFALGDEVRPAATVVLVVVNTIGVIVGVSLATARTGTPSAALRAASTTPLALAAMAALPVNVLDIELPAWIDRPVGLVAGALIPVMLLTLGLQLRAVDISRPEPGVFASGPSKLLVAPLIAWTVGGLVGLDSIDQGVVLIQASMPPAVFTMLVALEHDLGPKRMTSALVSITALSLLTVPIAVAIAR